MQIVIKQMITRSKQHAIVQQVFVPEVVQVVQIHQQLKLLPFEPIDFDLASDCWRANKMSIGNGMFKYVCPFMKIDNTRCGRNVKKGCTSCRYHHTP